MYYTKVRYYFDTEELCMKVKCFKFVSIFQKMEVNLQFSFVNSWLTFWYQLTLLCMHFSYCAAYLLCWHKGLVVSEGRTNCIVQNVHKCINAGGTTLENQVQVLIIQMHLLQFSFYFMLFSLTSAHYLNKASMNKRFWIQFMNERLWQKFNCSK